MTDALMASLWRASWQGAVVIAALWGFCRVFEARRWLSADLRCWLWRGAYVKLLFGLVAVGSIALPLLPPPAPIAGMPESAHRQESVSYIRTVFPPAGAPAATATVHGEEVNGPLVRWQTVIALFYLLGVGVCSFRVLQKGLATRRLLREAAAKTATAEDTETTAEIARLALRFVLRRTPRLLRSARVGIPCYAAGTVLLPAADYTAQELRLILAHELAHARRRDLVWEGLGTLTQIVFFFHPLVWLARREERLCREAAADALALRVTQAPAAAYGKLLLRFSLNRADMPLAGVIGIVDSGTLFRRRLSCLGEGFAMNKPTAPWKRLLFSAALFACVSVAVFVPWSLQAQAQQNREEASPQAKSPAAKRRSRDKYTINYDKQELWRKEANAAIEAGDTKLAARLAQQMLKNKTDERDWNYGNVVHQANQLLGLAALQEGGVGDAKRLLIVAGNTPGSPQINSFGPNMVLAQRLLEKGETAAVIQYLDLVARFWAYTPNTELARQEKRYPGATELAKRLNLIHKKQIDDWKLQIANGKTPTLNRTEQLY